MAVSMYVKPELRERLIVLAGSEKGYLSWVIDQLHAQNPEEPAPMGLSSLSRYMNNVRPVSPRLLTSLTRIAEQDVGILANQAWEHRDKWFADEPAVKEGVTNG